MNSFYDDGVLVDHLVKEYRGAHPEVSYRQALDAVRNAEKAAERKDREEFSRRVSHYSDRGVEGAPERVLKEDPSMAMSYAASTGQTASAERVAAVMRQAKKASSAARITMADAVMRILEGEPDVARKCAGDFLSARAMQEINNANVGSSIDQAFPTALAMTRRSFPEVDQMYQTGRVSELAMKIVFWPWFRD